MRAEIDFVNSIDQMRPRDLLSQAKKLSNQDPNIRKPGFVVEQVSLVFPPSGHPNC